MQTLPPDSLAPETLHNIIEHFVLREGSDYGAHECSLADKMADVEAQLRAGTVVITFDERSQSLNIVPQQQLPRSPATTTRSDPQTAHAALANIRAMLKDA